MASSAVAALMLARERQRIDAQCTHDIFLAKLLELSEAKIDIKSKHIFEFYKTVSSKGNKSQQKCCLPYSLCRVPKTLDSLDPSPNVIYLN